MLHSFAVGPKDAPESLQSDKAGKRSGTTPDSRPDPIDQNKLTEIKCTKASGTSVAIINRMAAERLLALPVKRRFLALDGLAQVFPRLVAKSGGRNKLRVQGLIRRSV